jgi:receptor protein-tyrosine kinase
MKFPFFSSAPARDIDSRRLSPGFTPLDVFAPENDTVGLDRSRDDAAWADDIAAADNRQERMRAPTRAPRPIMRTAPVKAPVTPAEREPKRETERAAVQRAPKPSAPAPAMAAIKPSSETVRRAPPESNRPEPSAARPKGGAPEGSIGAILVAARRISADDVRRVLVEQAVSSAPFGETAVRIGVASQSDIQFALARQFSMPCLQDGGVGVDRAIVAAFDPGHEVVEHLRGLRNEIAQRALYATPALRTVAIMGVERHVGRSYIAANLATVFAQLGARTLLIDSDLVNPRLHELFKLSNRSGLSSILAGRANLSAVCPVQGMPGFAVLPAGPTPPNPHDLIARPLMGHFLRRCERDFDVVLVDTPAWNAGSSARMAACAAGAAVLVIQSGRTMADGAVEVTREIESAGTKMIGVVVNQP